MLKVKGKVTKEEEFELSNSQVLNIVDSVIRKAYGLDSVVLVKEFKTYYSTEIQREGYCVGVTDSFVESRDSSIEEILGWDVLNKIKRLFEDESKI